MRRPTHKLKLDFKWETAPADPKDRLLGQLVLNESTKGWEDDCATILFGLPFDGAVLGRKGAAGGPTALRAAARTLKAYSFVHGELTTPILDLGDLTLPAGDIGKAHAITRHFAEELRARAQSKIQNPKSKIARVIALGGDHSLTFPCALPYLQEFGPRLAVINLDSHMDVRAVPKGQPPNSGSSFGRLLDHGLKSYTVIGARSFQTSPVYVKRVLDAGARIVTADDVHAKGAAKIARNVLRSLPKKCAAIYLSVDLDVADASVAPGVSAPTPGGLLAHQLLELVRVICFDRRVIACDIMELAPNLEEPNSDRTARLGAACLAEMIGTMKRET